MPRRPKDPADEFSYVDLAVAGGMIKSSIQMLAKDGLLPGDRGIRDLKHVSLIGAFASAGAPLLVAGRVVEKLAGGFKYDDFPSRLVDFDRVLGHSAFPADREITDYWRHRALRARPDLYTPGKAMPADAFFEVADKEHVFSFGGTLQHLDYMGRIDGWERGSAVSFVSGAETGDLTPDEIRDIRDNAVGKLTFNASLAIRNGFDRLAQHRSPLLSEEPR